MFARERPHRGAAQRARSKEIPLPDHAVQIGRTAVDLTGEPDGVGPVLIRNDEQDVSRLHGDSPVVFGVVY